jgi:hypothetical protein
MKEIVDMVLHLYFDGFGVAKSAKKGGNYATT